MNFLRMSPFFTCYFLIAVLFLDMAENFWPITWRQKWQIASTASSLFLFLAFSLRFLELAVASSKRRSREPRDADADSKEEGKFLTESCAQRISGTKTDYS